VSAIAETTTRSRRPTRRRVVLAIIALGLAGSLVAGVAVWTDALGAGHLFDRAVAKVDRFLAGPVPDRSAPGTVLVAGADESEEPEEPDEGEASLAPEPTAAPSPAPVASASRPTITPLPVPSAATSPTAVRRTVDNDIVTDHKAVFAHELKETWCAPAGVQMVLAILGHGDTSKALQRELQSRVRSWESYKDSHNGDWGPSAMALALDAYGAKGYEVRAYKTRQGALRDAAKAIDRTGAPVILLAWRGAHTWVMTGYRADADPTSFADAKIAGAYILDPWYPDRSSIWGQSDPPGTFQDDAEMVRNYLKWKRPEGKYPERDGLYISVVPTVVVKPAD
jgi:hypothetical protein